MPVFKTEFVSLKLKKHIILSVTGHLIRKYKE